jgi:hypothetical protein
MNSAWWIPPWCCDEKDTRSTLVFPSEALDILHAEAVRFADYRPKNAGHGWADNFATRVKTIDAELPVIADGTPR